MRRLCLDDRRLGAQATGVATYASTLSAAAHLLPLVVERLDDGGARPGRMLKLARALRPWTLGAEPTIEGWRVPDLFREAQVHFGLYGRPRVVRVDAPPDVMHWSYPVPLRVIGCANVYTVHDAIPLLRPDLTPISRARHRRLLAALLGAGGRLVSVSPPAARDVELAMGLAPGAVTDLGQAVPSREAIEDALPAGLPRRGYFLACGLVEPRKNLVALAAAHARAATGLPLVIAGPNGWQAAAIHRSLDGYPGVIRLGYQRRGTLAMLMVQARALLFPSLAEGFGLPIIEAMASGTPVMTSTPGATAHTAGGAAMLVDPLDGQAMASAIAALARDDALCAHLALAGRERAGDFALPGFAERLLAYYQTLNPDRH